jgi:RNA polymerase sigma-70 factor (ECF subfamily)
MPHAASRKFPLFLRKIPTVGGNLFRPMSRERTPEETLIRLITRHQGALRAYIFTLLPDPAQVDDVLQETNLVLWRKAAEYDPERPFMPWACRIALFQVKAARRDASRDRHVFDSELVDLLAAEECPIEDTTTRLDHALRDCLAQLPPNKRELILRRYDPRSSVAEMAGARRQSPGALSLELHRIRRGLEACIEGKLAEPLS